MVCCEFGLLFEIFVNVYVLMVDMFDIQVIELDLVDFDFGEDMIWVGFDQIVICMKFGIWFGVCFYEGCIFIMSDW